MINIKKIISIVFKEVIFISYLPPRFLILYNFSPSRNITSFSLTSINSNFPTSLSPFETTYSLLPFLRITEESSPPDR